MSPTSMYIAWGWKDIIPQLPALIHAFQTSEMNTPKMRRLCKFTALPEAMNNIGDRSDVYSFRIFLGTIITVKVSYETLDRLTARHTSLRCYRVACLRIKYAYYTNNNASPGHSFNIKLNIDTGVKGSI
ncbi:hypothetical protein AtNW77_Chr1g0023891 [Arabidopsis thaliana]|uniref:Dual specificity kinase n=1 Tax=Arabidopsis thaliana TaxID=3702 RepID=F4HWG0_ARATH|nr:dual specificity kinase [Arabidopsis thaliana]AEE30086.1 dual specificity kinase [Arabidopsis thaliana]|eukprot:NP_683318.1 dual specificity kinase [Arabidopsis thaliana]